MFLIRTFLLLSKSDEAIKVGQLAYKFYKDFRVKLCIKLQNPVTHNHRGSFLDVSRNIKISSKI